MDEDAKRPGGGGRFNMDNGGVDGDKKLAKSCGHPLWIAPYRTEIDRVEPKLWRFICVTLILGHPV